MLFKITQPPSPPQPHLSDPLSSDFKVTVFKELEAKSLVLHKVGRTGYWLGRKG